MVYTAATTVDNVLGLNAAAALSHFAKKLGFIYKWINYLLMPLYIPAFPPLYLGLLASRRKVLGTPKSRPEPKIEGIQFPLTSPDERSTSVTGRAAFAVSVASVDPQAATDCMKEKNWRFKYDRHVRKNVEVDVFFFVFFFFILLRVLLH